MEKIELNNDICFAIARAAKDLIPEIKESIKNNENNYLYFKATLGIEDECFMRLTSKEELDEILEKAPKIKIDIKEIDEINGYMSYTGEHQFWIPVKVAYDIFLEADLDDPNELYDKIKDVQSFSRWLSSEKMMRDCAMELFNEACLEYVPDVFSFEEIKILEMGHLYNKFMNDSSFNTIFSFRYEDFKKTIELYIRFKKIKKVKINLHN